MKNLGLFNKMVFIANLLLIIATFAGYTLPYLAPKLFPILSVFTLALPFFIVLNLFFFLYWLLLFKKQMIFSGVVLLIGITFINKLYKFASYELEKAPSDLTVMSYNVRLFNLYKWIDRDDIDLKISELIKEQNPDIICIQEYSENNRVDFKLYPERHLFAEGKKTLLGHGIFSKFPIFNKGKIDFPNSTNNASFADIKRGKDTIRVYSIHLQSIRITPEVEELDSDIQKVNEHQSKRMFKSISKAFRDQQEQAEIIREHINQSPYKVVVCGDMNNSAFSYVYRTVKGNLNDGFEVAGKGFGQTYYFKYYPARIDYIFADTKWEVKTFETFSNFKNSDHVPIMIRLGTEKSI